MKPQDEVAGAPSGAKIRAAVEIANIPTLACMLVQMTGDRRWIEAPFVPTRSRGLDDNDSGGLDDDIQRQIREAAVNALEQWFETGDMALPDPPDELLVELMSVSLGEDIPLMYAPMIRHELKLPTATEDAADIISRAAASQVDNSRSAKPLPGFRVLIIGAGISGLCCAYELTRAGIPYTIVERNDRVGGVWLENRYPGAACDVPSHLYSFSFAPYDWSRYFAGRDEIHEYLEHIADSFGIRENIRFNVEVVEARFDDDNGEWQLQIVTPNGGTEILRANAVVSAVGAFNKPRFPDVEGLDEFEGESAHTARWPDDGIDLKGKRVVVVGNGASAMQVVPAIADDVASLTIIQRSAQWAAPFQKFKKEIPQELRWLLNEVPIYRLWYRLRLSWAFNDKLYEALQRDPGWEDQQHSINAINDLHRRGLTEYMKSELGDAQHLLPQVLPSYPPFGKRMLLDNGWCRTLRRKHVQLVTGAVTRVRPDRVETSNGDEYVADVLIWATGFDVVNFIAPIRVIGRGGLDLHEEWQGDDARAYLGTVVPGFPNFFCLYGPNTQFGHGGSLITIVERQMHYVMMVLKRLFEEDRRLVEVRKEPHDAYTSEVDRKHQNMIWTHQGMSTYYRNSKGRVVVCNPFRVIEFWEMTDDVDPADYDWSIAATPNTGDERVSP